ncbi:histidine kinase [Photobacterium aquae]|uniref:histidine kinase n=1 Tax=Photobacterium aquae TaxID=1195763 RepID=A0A0J1K3Q0_9GAMM|nr:HAMP domain-containing sensor histidine kinase [Photobacterium aquae]KLV09037.1 histidine kinase [Photobacterium aquae]
MDKATALNPNPYPSIYRQIKIGFLFMTLCTFVLFWKLIYIAENQLEIISLHHWLDTEASRYVNDYAHYGQDTLLPNPNEFNTYSLFPTNTHMENVQLEPPAWLKHYREPGFYEQMIGTEDKHFIVLKHPSGEGLMYIVFQDDADDYLDAYEKNLHLATVGFGLFLSLCVVLYGIYFIRILSKPLASIAQKITQMSPEHEAFKIETKFEETRQIEQTLLDSKQEIARYFQREKDFSRFASHELRTPIMVIQGSAELLEKVPNQPKVALKAIGRVQDASQEMRVLTEAFLLLGKESIDDHHLGRQPLALHLRHQLEVLEPLFAKQNAGYDLTITEPGFVIAPESFITIIINNLIKNAFSYSVGNIHIALDNNQLTITNCHDGNSTFNAGYGCGLVIVERICERMGWSFKVHNDSTHFQTMVYFTPTA